MTGPGSLLSTKPTSRPHGWLLACMLLTCCTMLLPGKAEAWWDANWAFRKTITIDATAAGGGLTEDAGRVPVLIRLHDGNYSFSDGKPDGTDIRFIAADDKTPLNAHVETFDNVFDIGLVWVDVPALKAGTTQSFYLYYGNPKADSGNDPHASYDSDEVLVYHFTEKTGVTKDWTSYGNNSLNTVTQDSAALIGGGAKFDGSHVLAVPGGSSMAVAAGGAATLSVWVKQDNLAGDQVVYARHDGGGSLVIGLDAGKPYVAINGVRSDGDAALAVGQWHHLALTADDKLIFYVDSEPKLTLSTRLPALTTAATLGGDAAAGATPGAVSSGFIGSMDELEISRVARSSGYIRALFTSQGTLSPLVTFGKDESGSSLSTGYVGIIIHSVTLDGWVVIGILMVMAVISWWVMYDRAGYVSRVGKYNTAFLAAYKAADRDVVRFEQMMLGKYGTKPTRAQFRKIERAPLYKLLATTVDELEERYGRRQSGEVGPFALTSATLDAIRASVDSTLVREIQGLNNMMVLLTIAISGGPFIGLLGTVVGVMITFAAIAASGDVNVNSIAPGIAAALLATCAGMFVAIPALFGYNYLTVRIKEQSTVMHAFSEQFITRLAELYHVASAPRAAHAAE